MRLLDRYVIRNFVQVYFYCIAGFTSIWLIFDVSDNISSFIDNHIRLSLVARYYATQIPQVLIILLPVALLLSLLFALGRMSRSNEIVSMLTAGVSLPRVLLPLIGIGLLTVAASMALNYSLAPHAELARKKFLSEAQSRPATQIQGQVFRNRTDLRTWFIQNFRLGDNMFNNVQVLQQDANDNIVMSYVAARAYYRPETKTWDLENVRLAYYDAAGNITKEEFRPTLTIEHWSETPFRLSSANVQAESLSVPELREYLHFNADFPPTLLAPFRTHFQYRLALPWTCLVVVCIAAPLGIGYSRRGVLSSVAAAVILVFSNNFLVHLFLALGEGDRVPGWIAAWTPNILFAAIGLYLLYLRASNREPPSFNLVCRAAYSCAMNPLPNEWAIKHRADSCAVTQRPFVPGEYFYTLLYHGADGYRREDLSEEAWQNRNENIRPFSFWKSRYEPLPPKPAEPVPKESAEQLFRRLMASDSPPANACYVLAAMLERKRVLKQVKTESRDRDAFSFTNRAPQATCSSCLTRNCAWTNWKMCRTRWQSYFAEPRKTDNV